AIVLADLDGAADTRIFVIENGAVKLIKGLPDANSELDMDIREMNTADGEQIGRFIKWARGTYAAEKTIFSFIGHGGPLTPETEFHALFPSATSHLNDPLPILPTYLEVDPAVTDAHTGDAAISFDILSTYDVRRALEIGTDNGANPLDVVDLVHCFAATVEELYETTNSDGTPFTEMIVASPLYAYFSSKMPGTTLAAFDVNADAETLAKTVMTTYQEVIDAADVVNITSSYVEHPGIITVVDAAALENVKSAMDRLSANLVNEFRFGEADTRLKLHNAYTKTSLHYDSNFCKPHDFELSAPDALVDIGAFMDALMDEFSGSRFNVDFAALAVKSSVTKGALGSAIVAHSIRSGSPWFAGDFNPTWYLDQPSVAGLGLYADMGGIIKNGRRVISWQYPFYIKADSAEALQFVKDDSPFTFTWADVLTRYWDGTELDTMLCLPDLPSTRSVGEIAVIESLLSQGTLGVNQAIDIAIAIRADTLIENNLLKVQIMDPTGTVVYSDTTPTGYLPEGKHEIVMEKLFTPTMAGNHIIEPVIDVDNRIVEANEGDNQLNDEELKQLVVHRVEGSTIDIETVGGQEWFDSPTIDLTLTFTRNDVPVSPSYLFCNIFELTVGDDPTVRLFKRTHTLTFSNPTPDFTLTLPDDVQAGRIKVKCRGMVGGEFTVRPGTVEFNYAPAYNLLANETNHFIFTSDDSKDNLFINIGVTSGEITATIWEPLNFFSAHQIEVQAGQTGQFTFDEAYEGDYLIIVEGSGNYSISAERNDVAARHATTIVTPHLIQLERPDFIAGIPRTDVLPILEIMNVKEGAMIDDIKRVEVKAQNMSDMDAVEIYVGYVHVGNGVPMRTQAGMYTVELDPMKLPMGRQVLMIKAMGKSSAIAEMHLDVCIRNCGATSAVDLHSTEVRNTTPPFLLLVIMLAIITVIAHRQKRTV
ncbi:MAG: hypothetical protein ACPG8W_20595, partial [Candidatus Promineifilaceae bacterium]